MQKSDKLIYEQIAATSRLQKRMKAYSALIAVNVEDLLKKNESKKVPSKIACYISWYEVFYLKA